MSRGLGKTQRAILKHLESCNEAELTELVDACGYVFPERGSSNSNPSAGYVAVSRAITALEKRGLVEKEKVWEDEPNRWVHGDVFAHLVVKLIKR